MKIKHIYLLSVLFFIVGCTDLEPKLDTAIDQDAVWKDRDFAMGVLNDAYSQLSAFYTDELGTFLDCATDNAVTNNFSSGIISMATGGWTAQNNPINSWTLCYNQIRNLNLFIENSPEISFSNDTTKNVLIHKRVKGEAYFLRAWYQFELLSRFSGFDNNGNLLGFPIVLEALSDEELKTVERSTFDACVSIIKDDLDTALVYLPVVQYIGSDVVLGATQTGRIYRLPALALKSRLLLYAASPAYTTAKSTVEKQILWENAAIAAMVAIQSKGALPTVSASGDLYSNPNHAEIIWRSYQPDSNAPEKDDFMPSLWGNGRTNPSQQLVDAFPMKDGYPVSTSPTYNPTNPYANRDNRFGLTIVYNDANFGSDKAEIFVGGKDSESSGQTRATRTGYYLRKFIVPGVIITPGLTATTTKHYYAFFRSAELWLNYAEAANEAWDPEADPLSLGKAAKTILAELRKRAGIATADPYLNQKATAGKEDFRTLIHNERRIELSFENHRFFDVRRWLLPLSELNQDVSGVLITKDDNNVYTYRSVQKVEARKFFSYMYYGPLPEQAIYTSGGAIVQNAGW
ncbi:MAG: RagB/SusD family nutrient uptake outer membrane protein [Paludibacter sp.]|nr:RagB/SusD family nutrient uptake outer membrane protein [Paludibacter sp.]